jgi:hypothetical protein
MKRATARTDSNEAAAKRWALDQNNNLVEHARGPLVVHEDYRRLRIAHDRIKDKLRQVSVLYRTALKQRERLEQQRGHGPPAIAAELTALRKLARVVAKRAGNNAEIQQALRQCVSQREQGDE